MKPQHRARLLEIAAKRGERGFSSVVAEAIHLYLDEQAKKERLRRKALRAGGSLNRRDGDDLRRRVAEIRVVRR